MKKSTLIFLLLVVGCSAGSDIESLKNQREQCKAFKKSWDEVVKEPSNETMAISAKRQNCQSIGEW